MAVKKKIVLIQGAFDILHAAHIRAFKFAKAQGDYLIVALNTDRLIKRYKTKRCLVPWQQRRIMIEACRYVDKVIPATEFSPLKLLKAHKVDVYVLSREWRHTKDVEFEYMKKSGGVVRFSARSRTISSSAIKAKLLKEHLDAQRENNKRTGELTFSKSAAGSASNGGVPPVDINGNAAGLVREGESGAVSPRLS